MALPRALRRIRTRTWLAGAAILFAAFFHHAILQRFILFAAGSATGTSVDAESARIGWTAATFNGVTVRATSDVPLVRIERLDVRYDLARIADANYIAGIYAIDAVRPAVTILRYDDGTYDLPHQSTANNRPLALILRGAVHDGSIVIADETASGAPRLRFDRIEARFDVNTTARTTYAASLAYRSGSQRYPIAGEGNADAGTRTMLQRWTAPRIPIAAIATFAANDRSFRMRGGVLEHVEALYAGLPAGGAMDSHLGGSAVLRDGSFSVAGLAKAVRLTGRFVLTGRAVTTQDLVARAGGTTIHVSGGIFDFAHPSLRLAAAAAGDLARARALVAYPALASMRGTFAISALAAGPGSNPSIFAALRARNATYGALRADRAGALGVVDKDAVHVISFRASTGHASVFAAGRAAFAGAAGTAGILHAEAPSSIVAATDAVVPGMFLRVDALADSQGGGTARVRGLVSGKTAAQSLLGAFDTSAAGSGTFGPLRLDGAPGTLYARGSFDLPQRSLLALALFHHLRAGLALPIRSDALANGALFVHERGTTLDLATRGTIGGGAIAAFGSLGPHRRLDVDASNVDLGTIRSNGATLKSGKLDVVATLAGPLNAIRSKGAVAIGGGAIAGRALNANAAFAENAGAVSLTGAHAAIGTTLVDVDGQARATGAAPAFDVAMRVRGADLRDVAGFSDPQLASIVDGSLDADVHLSGTAASPAAAGTFAAPEGSFNGQAFREVTGSFAGTRGTAGIRGGSMDVGATHVAFDGSIAPGSETLSVHAPAIDFADFNDLFDRGDVLAGRGRLDVQVDAAGQRVVSSRGSGSFSNARVLQFPLGDGSARWSSSRGNLAIRLAFGGSSGTAGVDGTIRLADDAVNLRAHARGVDLATWMPLAGIDVPVAVTGRANADLTAHGRYPRLSLLASANLRNGTAGRVPIDRLDVTASAEGGNGRIDAAHLSLPYLEATAAGTFPLEGRGPLHVSVRANSPDAGRLAATLTGKPVDAAGAADATLDIGGTLADPRLDGRLRLQRARYARLLVPSASGEATLERGRLVLVSSEVDLEKGRMTAAASLPVSLHSAALAPGPVAARATLDDVELSSFAGMLPKHSTLSGRVDGTAGVTGTTSAPQLTGLITLSGGTFSSPLEEVPLSSLDATIAAHGSTVELVGMHGKAGAGTFDLSGRARAPSLLRASDVAVSIDASAHGAQFDLPAYFKGQVDGTLALARLPGATPHLTGDVRVSHARMPVSAFLQASGAAGGSKPPNLALDLGVRAESDVRVQSPNVDVGGTGALRVSGTLAEPHVGGRIAATGGTIDFYRDFRLERASVTFDPSGVPIPNVNAVATTYISDPETDVKIAVDGPATAMQLTLSSDPSYDRTQILGLLAGVQNFGTIPGVAASSGSAFSAPATAENLAFGQVNQSFTRELLDPLSANLGSALGLANLDLYSGLGEGFGFSARQKIGQHLSATGSELFGARRRQDIEVGYHSSSASAVSLHLYQQQVNPFDPAPSQASVGNVVFNVVPSTLPPIDGGGTSGISFSLERKFP